MADDEKRKRGLEKFEQVMQFPAPDLRGDAFVDCTMDHLFADVWADPRLAVRDRRLVTLTILACLGNEMTMKLHFGAAMRSGDCARSRNAFVAAPGRARRGSPSAAW